MVQWFMFAFASFELSLNHTIHVKDTKGITCGLGQLMLGMRKN